ncbi:hypothetical protein M407DRAFT_110415 [Tulasnella calospora MUT 4182]|uniref:Uncharacterized protein n=1 Tax=Tulasnella calospora MUT 4182 TaxID=1051891 RepID=A0A0C3KPL2_9AGAM|nr:hypothetical protein M407DRAFT_110415 [Tulasnella calospora MUT 4182]
MTCYWGIETGIGYRSLFTPGHQRCKIFNAKLYAYYSVVKVFAVLVGCLPSSIHVTVVDSMITLSPRYCSLNHNDSLVPDLYLILVK